jgi:hypothetical protein
MTYAFTLVHPVRDLYPPLETCNRFSPNNVAPSKEILENAFFRGMKLEVTLISEQPYWSFLCRGLLVG